MSYYVVLYMFNNQVKQINNFKSQASNSGASKPSECLTAKGTKLCSQFGTNYHPLYIR